MPDFRFFLMTIVFRSRAEGALRQLAAALMLHLLRIEWINQAFNLDSDVGLIMRSYTAGLSRFKG